MKDFFISDVFAFAPGIGDSPAMWKNWRDGKIAIEQTKDSPKLEYTDPLFRRRLSQITKMTVHVVHNLLAAENIDKETKIVFVSLRGEIEREFLINKSLIQENAVLPAAFSLSVFNAPVSSATLAFGLKGGYSAIYPSKNNFADAFKAAVAPILAGTENQIIFVYADELVPEYYGDKRPAENIPCAFAFLVGAENKTKGKYKKMNGEDLQNIGDSPVNFLKNIL